MEEEQHEGEYLLIDICGTLFKSNTTFDFVRYYFGQKKRVKFWFSLPYRIYNRLMYKCFHREPLRMNLISMLKGISKDRLEEMAEQFLNDYLLKRELEPVIPFIDYCEMFGAKLIIVSATIDVIAHAVARYYEIDECLSTQLNYNEDGICEGTIAYDLLSNKKEALAKINILPPYYGVMTDNYSDIDLIHYSEDLYLISHNRSTKTWKKILTPEEDKRASYILP